MQLTLSDPRRYPDAALAPPEDRLLYSLAEATLAAGTSVEGDRAERALRGEAERRLAQGISLKQVLEGAPSLAVHRAVWRMLARCTGAPLGGGEVGVVLFAFPVVLVAAAQGDAPVRLPALLAERKGLQDLMRAHGAPAGCQVFSLAPAMVDAEAIDAARLPALLAAARLRELPVVLDLAPAALEAGPQAAHLRFLVGAGVMREGALDAAAAFEPLAGPLSRWLGEALGSAGASVLALPRPPASPLLALQRGRSAQREIAAQLFASSALRELRASAGEPVAVLSAHRCPDAPGGGELRLSLSSPFSPRDAHGFRCPLYGPEPVADAVTMLADLMRDCRVADLRVVGGVHDDRDPVTGAALMFKPGTIPPASEVVLQ
jgi:hypothetical protein